MKDPFFVPEKPYYLVKANFNPTRNTSMKENRTELIGKEFIFERIGSRGENDAFYKGQGMYMFPDDICIKYNVLWAPEEDLEFIEFVKLVDSDN